MVPRLRYACVAYSLTWTWTVNGYEREYTTCEVHLDLKTSTPKVVAVVLVALSTYGNTGRTTYTFPLNTIPEDFKPVLSDAVSRFKSNKTEFSRGFGH